MFHQPAILTGLSRLKAERIRRRETEIQRQCVDDGLDMYLILHSDTLGVYDRERCNTVKVARVRYYCNYMYLLFTKQSIASILQLH